MEDNNKNKADITTKQIWFGIFLVVILIGGYLGANQLLSPHNNNSTEKKIDNIEKILSPYQNKDNMSKTEVTSNFSNSSKENKPTDSFSKTLSVVGDIGGGYLYIKASAGGKALNPSEDDIYIKLLGNVNNKYQEIGGHLIGIKSLDAPKSQSFTELLYDLSDVRYKSSYLQGGTESVSGDFLQLINGGTNQVIVGFSSTNKSGIIEEISIYYSCTNNSNCSIGAK